MPPPPGQIVILNGVPRSGKSSIASAIQATFDGAWMNLGVDRFKAMTPEHLQPGIGLTTGWGKAGPGACAARKLRQPHQVALTAPRWPLDGIA